MAVFRVERTGDYTVMSNFHLKDKRLSLIPLTVTRSCRIFTCFPFTRCPVRKHTAAPTVRLFTYCAGNSRIARVLYYI